jgi:predicted outer membrane repeat protein
MKRLPVGPLAAAIATALTLPVMFASPVSAATFYVKPDGSGDVPTIQDGVYAATSGDTLLLADGTFSGDGNRDVRIIGMSLTVRSESGDPDLCIIDCGGSASENHLAFDIEYDGTPPVLLRDITVRGGYSTSAGAVYVGHESAQGKAAIQNCVFTDNTSVWSGGAILVIDDCTADLWGCRFTANSATTGAAVYALWNSNTVFDECTFSDNSATEGGAVDLYDGAAVFSDCTFSGNMATDYGGALYAQGGAQADFHTCILADNHAPGGGGAVYLEESNSLMTDCISLKNEAIADGVGGSIGLTGESSAVIMTSTFVADSSGQAVIWVGPEAALTLDRSIIAFGRYASAVYCFDPADNPALTCCDIYGNEFGDWIGCIAGQAGLNDNFSLDPEFCDIPTGDLTVEDCSPCLAAHSSCGEDVGAGGMGCNCGEATWPSTWGIIKAQFGR